MGPNSKPERGNVEVIETPLGYRRLDPIPSDEQLKRYYESKFYHEMLHNKGKQSITRFLNGGEEAHREAAWLKRTVWEDIAQDLAVYQSGKRVLELGAGLGKLLSFLKERGFEVSGVEPSHDAVERAHNDGVTLFCGTIAEFHQSTTNRDHFDVAILLGVLEHIPNPESTLEMIRDFIVPGGLIVVNVPNEFNSLQLCASKSLGLPEWWISSPAHINYFNPTALRSILEHTGFELLRLRSDFPMEMFLLFGDNYVDKPELGSECQSKRMRFEMSIPPDLRRKIYEALSSLGIGRTITAIAKKT